MPKSLDVSPDRFDAGRSTLPMPEIPVYAYRTPLASERETRGDAALRRVLRDMHLVRAFETMLNALRSKGEHEGVVLPYRGPAHLSVGQEGAAVGLALALSADDHVYGNHRSHGEFLAKGLAAIAELGDNALTERMASHDGGRLLHLVESRLGGTGETLAERFLLFGFLAEILMRATGFNGGMGGSMHAFFPPFGAYPNNAIVGGSAGIATGAALAMRLADARGAVRANGPAAGTDDEADADDAGAAARRDAPAVDAATATRHEAHAPDDAGGTGRGEAHTATRRGARIAVATAGDGASGCGPVWEAMGFAAMAQLETLWPEAARGGLPVLFFFTNNFYAMGGQTIGETGAWERLSRVAAGVRADALHAETVDGTRPLAVADAVARARERLLAGEGPCLLDIECYRQSGHSTSDANAYRSREELRAWAAHDPIERFAAELVEAGAIDAAGVEQTESEARALVRRVLEAVADPAVAPPVDIRANPTLIGELMFADGGREGIDGAPTESRTNGVSPASGAGAIGVGGSEHGAASGDAVGSAESSGVEGRAGTPDVREGTDDAPSPSPAIDPTTSSRVRQNAKKARFGLDENGEALSPMRAITLRDALFEAVLSAMLADERLVAWGEECREWGGAFGVYRGLADLFPRSRLFNAPISEAAIVATAVGHALEGGRSLVELMYADFIGRAGDEILNQMAKWRAMSGGTLDVPVTLRCSVGSKYGAQHSQDWSSLVAHVPGLRVFYPATPHDAKGLLASALAGRDPVVFFESQRLYDTVERFVPGGVPTDDYRLPIGVPATRRAGTDLVILTIGPSLYPALEAAATLEREHALSAEVIDARCLVPFDYAPVLDAARRTGRLLIVSEACERGGFAMTLAANVARFAHGSLREAPRVLGAPNWIVPGAEMESTYFPGADDVLDVVLGEWFADRAPGYERRGARRWNDLELARRGL